MASIPQAGTGGADSGVDGSVDSITDSGVDMSEASRQLELAAHDARVAYDCLALGDIERAHVHTITARAATDAAEHVLRAALGEDSRMSAGR